MIQSDSALFKATHSVATKTPALESSWLSHLETEFQAPYMQQLKAFLLAEQMSKKKIGPAPHLFFEALNRTPLDKVKVVILGQDPYHGPNQAHGLSFSVQPHVEIPPSLKNIFKELETDLGIPKASHGHLVKWADQGVLLLNATLSVELGRAGSHQNKGWEIFTDRVIEVINSTRNHIAFILWGSYAQKKGAFIDPQKHFILKSPHPSPLSCHRGFWGSKPFSKVNDYLLAHNIEPIDWRIP